MHIVITSVHGNPNVGLFGFANDSFCLLGREVPNHTAKEIEQALRVPVHRVTICGTSLVGAFCAGNNQVVLVPGVIHDEEKAELDRLGIPYQVISTKLTALGNNILCNDVGCLVNPEFSADVKKRIRQALNVKLKPGLIAGLPTVGSCGVANAASCFLHRDATDEEIAYIEDLLEAKAETGTVNLASPYIRSGIICNSRGFVVGDRSGGPEITFIDQALGFMDRK
ncbi:translation initiation factor IF-6 [Candidatus Woesearchaeota archaeon]|nr:translation initiation factor IF-6 [Candidatus Woesearchaeota archaeon]